MALTKIRQEQGVIINDGSTDVDFRVESNGNANMLYVDGGNNAVVVGQSSPDTDISGATPQLQVIGTGVAASTSITRREANQYGPTLFLTKSRNTSVGSNTIVNNGDALGVIAFIGDDGTNLDTYGATITASVDATPGANDMPTRLSFSVTADGASSPTERMRIHSSGVIAVPVGIQLGTVIDTGTTPANTLDDYEEGTWTPVLEDSSSGEDATMNTGAGNGGAYTKVGRNVTVSAHVAISSIGSMTGPVRLTGLPFTNINSQTGRAAISCGFGVNLNLSANTSLAGYVELNQSFMELTNWDNAAGTTSITAEEISADGVFFFSVTYPSA